jgi:nucleoid DNA-binding protein
MSNIASNFKGAKGARTRGLKRKRYKGTKWTEVNIAAEITRLCNIPQVEALKIIQIVLSCIINKLKSQRRVRIKGFGRFKRSKWKRPGNRADYRIYTFIPGRELNRLLGNKPSFLDFQYEFTLARKIHSLLLAKKCKQAKLIYKNLKTRLKTRPLAVPHLVRNNLWPIDI